MENQKVSLAMLNQRRNKMLTPTEFAQKASEEFSKVFPNAWSNINVINIFGTVVSFSFGILPKDKVPGKIAQNDPAYHSGLIQEIDKNTGLFKDKISLEFSIASLLIKPPAGSFLAYGRVKTGFRKISGTPEKVLDGFVKYLKKLKQIVDDNKDNMTEHHKNLMK